MGKLYDALFGSGYRGRDLERFLARAVFCLFADDTGIFERDIFLDFIESRTGEDGPDTGARRIKLFRVLDTPESERRAARDEDLLGFPNVNGPLFDTLLRPKYLTYLLTTQTLCNPILTVTQNLENTYTAAARDRPK